MWVRGEGGGGERESDTCDTQHGRGNSRKFVEGPQEDPRLPQEAPRGRKMIVNKPFFPKFAAEG